MTDSADAAYRKCRQFVAVLAEREIEVVAVCAGSRSTPMALAFHDDGRFKIFTHVDERSAGFFTLGAARATGKPAVVLTTSGTAAANLLPAVVEARAAGVPLIAVTADRPPELHDVGAMQTIEQTRLLSPAIWAADLHAYDEEAPAAFVAARAHAHSAGPPAGPVHVNVRAREPLVPSKEVRTKTSLEVVVPDRARGRTRMDPDDAATVAAALAGIPRGLIYAGHLETADAGGTAEAVGALAAATGYPVIVEATSRLRGLVSDGVVDSAEALVRSEAFAGRHIPDAIVRIGRAPLTRRMQEWLDGSGASVSVVIDENPAWSDPGGSATHVVAADPALALSDLTERVRVEESSTTRDSAWCDEWMTGSAVARTSIDACLDSSAVFEGTVARALVEALPGDGVVYVATSLPIRALDAFTSASRSLEALANRGASGIDGTISGALGASAATGRPTACLMGDLAFLHDVGGLLASIRHRIPLVTVVIDNSGGGIFEFLPQVEGVERETFEDLFIVPHELDLMRAAELYGAKFAAVRDTAGLPKALSWAFTEGGSWVIRVPVNRAESVEAHAAAWRAADEAIRAGGL